MKVKFFLLLILSTAALAGFAQGKWRQVDSLLTAAKESYPSDSALLLEQKALAVSQDIGFVKGQAKSLFYIGFFYQNVQDPVKAIESYLPGTQIKFHLDSLETRRWVLSSHINTSNILSDFELHEGSIQILKKALELCPDTTCNQFPIIQYNLQKRYYKAKKYDKSMKVLKEMRSYYPKESDDYFDAMNGIGIIYNETNQLEKAITHFKKQIIEAKKYSKPAYVKKGMHNLADAYYHSGQLDSAKSILTRLIQQDSGFDSQTSYFTTYKDLMTILCELGAYKEALHIWSKTKPTVEKASIDRGDFYEVYRDVALAYEQTGRKDRAEAYRNRYEQEHEKFLNTQSDLEQNHKKTNFLYTQAQLKATMQEFYANLAKERKYIQRLNLLSAISIGLAALIVIMLTYYFYKKHKMRKWLSDQINKLESAD